MSIYSTLDITRSKAIEIVVTHLELALARAKDGLMSDDELTKVLDAYLEPHLNNARIADDNEQNDDDRIP